MTQGETLQTPQRFISLPCDCSLLKNFLVSFVERFRVCENYVKICKGYTVSLIQANKSSFGKVGMAQYEKDDSLL